jgi:hypothetical protein
MSFMRADDGECDTEGAGGVRGALRCLSLTLQ